MAGINITIRLNKEVVDALDKLAEKDHRTRAGYIKKIIQEDLEKN